jgi:hypothetical protein
MQHQRNIIRLSSQYLLLPLAFQLAKLLDIQGNSLLLIIPVALSNSSIELLGRLHRRTASLVSTSRYKNDVRLEIVDVELVLLLLIARVQWSSDTALP